MLKIKSFLSLFIFAAVLHSCEIEGLDGDNSFINTVQTSGQDAIVNITNDNSGKVIITPSAEGFSKSIVHFGEGSSDQSVSVAPGKNTVHIYPEGNYTVTIDYYDIAGKMTTKTYPFTITYRAPENIAAVVDISAHTVKVSPKADYAKGFEVYYGEPGKDTPIIISAGEEATYTYAARGTYNIKVIALSGGKAKTEYKETIEITRDPLQLPITFEDPYQDYNAGGTFGGVSSQVIDNPFSSGINTTSKIWKFVKSQDADTWGGTWTPMQTNINIDNGKKFKILVYATEIGKSVHFQLEDGSSFKPGVDVPITVANQWQELTFDFTSLNIPNGHLFSQFVVQYNLPEKGAGEVIYLDNIRQTN